MYQVPTPVWNEVAATQRLNKPTWAGLFAKTGQDFLPACERVENAVDKLTRDATVTRAYMLTAPLLHENQAISRYLEATQAQSLRAAMPELTTIPEAVGLATDEFNLLPSQQDKLATLLTQEPPSPAS